MSSAFDRITLVSVTGLPDASGAALALKHSLAQMPGAAAVLCSPQKPEALQAGITHIAVAPMNYHEYGWFMMFALWRVVHTDFALVVQDDGWVVNAANWRDDFLQYDYIGAPIHLARVATPTSAYWANRFQWADEYARADCTVTPVQNGGFSLRSRRFMRALLDHPHIKVEVLPPDAVTGGSPGDPLTMHWHHKPLLEDVQLSGVLRPALEAIGMRYAPVELARVFSIEHAGPQLHHGWNALQLFGHHAKVRRLVSLEPLTVHSDIPPSELDQWYGEREILAMFERLGYVVEHAAERTSDPGAPSAMNGSEALRTRKVYDCFTYNGEADILAARMNELADVVDWFVIVEAARTFNGDAKTLTFDAADPRIAPFMPRIRYYVVTFPEDAADPDAEKPIVGDWLTDRPQTNAWMREKFQRNQLVLGIGDALADDLIMVSDVDEIPRAGVVGHMRDDHAHDVFGLSQALFYFYANYRNVEGPEVAGIWGVAATRARLAASTPDKLRIEVRTGALPAFLIADAGWHLSYMGMSDDDVRRKISTFVHQEYNTPERLAAIDVRALTAAGSDLYGRPGYAWRLVDASEAPAWLAAQPDLQRLFMQPLAQRDL